MTFKDILDACCYTKEDETTANTVISILTGPIDQPEQKTIFMDVNFSFCKKGDIFEAIFYFRNKQDLNMQRMFHLLQQYEKDIQTKEDESIQFSLVPLELKGKYQLLLADPFFFSLSAEKVLEYPQSIRLLFDTENVIVLEHENMDYAGLVAKAQRSLDMEQFYEQEEEKRKLKEKELQEREDYTL